LQKTREKSYPAAAEKIERRSLLEENTTKTMLKKAVRFYLERIRNRMQKPIEGLSLLTATSTKNNVARLK